MIGNKKRVKWIDLVKGGSICGVVMGHSITQGILPHLSLHGSILLPLAYLLYIFVMPAFFSISGYLYVHKRVTSVHTYFILIYKKLVSFCIPYILFTILVFLIDQVGHHKLSNSNIRGFFDEIFMAPSYIWFLYALFGIFIISGIMDLFHIKLRYQLIIYIILLSIQLRFGWTVGNVSPYCGVLSFGIFFCLGEFISIYKVSIKKHIICINILNVLSLILLVIYLIFIRKSGMDMDNVFIPNLIPKLLSVPVIFRFCQLVNPNRGIFKYLTYYGKYSLIIYLVHFYVTVMVGDVIYNMPSEFIQFIIIFSISWIISVCVCWISNKNKIINFIFNTRKYTDKYALTMLR